MLRDFIYSPNSNQMCYILGQFDIPEPIKNINIFTLLEFKVITPDSFLWRILIEDTVYYLYTEDFITSLDDIENKIYNNSKEKKYSEFIKAKKPIKFKNTSPVIASQKYKKPKKVNEIMKYAATSGYDFVFLAKTDEDVSNAFFA